MKTTYHLTSPYGIWTNEQICALRQVVLPPGPIRVVLGLKRPDDIKTPRLDTTMAMVLVGLVSSGVDPDRIVELESKVKASKRVKATITIGQVTP